jgi:hypothetical protein
MMAVLALILALVVWVARHGRAGPSMATLARTIAYRPGENLPPTPLLASLFGCKLTLLMRDNFNQLASAQRCLSNTQSTEMRNSKQATEHVTCVG